MQSLNSFIDERGVLVPIELRNLPFEPKRMFYVTNVPKGTWRGNHAHYKNKQILICVKGQILVKTETESKTEELILNQNEFCIINNFVWDSQKFLDENSVLLVICSENYDLNDYIFDKSILFDKKK